jgi:hypothetical protein
VRPRGATVTDEVKRIYLMKNINEKIFKWTLFLWCRGLTWKSFPDKYDTLKAYIMNEYFSQMTQPEIKKCWYYDPTLKLQENKRQHSRKSKQAQKREKAKVTERKQALTQTPPKEENPAEVHKGMIVLLLPPKEKAGLQDA